MPADPEPVPAATRGGALTIGILLPLTAACYGLIRHTAPFSSAESLWGTWALAGPAGLVVGLLYWHRFRGQGLVPIVLTGAAVVGIWAAVNGWCQVTVAVASGLLGVAVTRLLLALDRFYRGIGCAPWILLGGIAGFILGGGVENLEWFRPLKGGPGPIPVFWFAGVTAVAAVIAWVRLFPPAFELAAVEPPMYLMYRVRATGPGLSGIPLHGPCLVIANHACWLDPAFLGEVLPRPVTPMMTSKFYDLPVLSWLMRQLGVIRVPELEYKRQDVPGEVQEAIAALDRGECVLIFPEGMMRRGEDKPLKRFGRGVWQILTARPQTPVFPCWIEGNWGSFCSYYNGKPTKNKRPDFRRPIRVAVAGAVTVGAETLGHHLRTRLTLMNHVIAARTLLGLPELPAFELPAAGDKGEKDE